MMLFFRSAFSTQYPTRHSNLKHSKKYFAPLQVRIHKVVIKENIIHKISEKKISGKRALSWASFYKEKGISKEKKGSLTLEAALCFPLLLFFCVILLMPVILMDRQRQIQAVVEAVGEEISQYAYGAYLYENGQKEGMDVSRAEEAENGSVLEKVTAVYAVAAVKKKIPEKWVRDVSFFGTKITEDEKIQIIMKYKMPLPFSVFGIDGVAMETVCSRRLWTGADGGREKGNTGTGEKEKNMVYIGRSSTRYHIRSDCHYLFHNLKQVQAEKIADLRNQEGKRYKPCVSCKSSGENGLIYVLPYGESYHTRADCISLSAYVEEVPLDQVEYLGACSYCGQ